jgi:hypothetical protein
VALAFDTAGSIVSQAAFELGLSYATIADPFKSTNPAILQLCALLTSLGRDIRREKQWSWLQQSYQFSTVAGQGFYPIPSDFDSVIPQTQWNRTTRLPVGGPLSPQDFTAVKASLVGVVFTVLDRFVQGQQLMYPDTNTPGGYLIAYEYISRWWVVGASPVQGAWAANTQYAKFQIVSVAGGQLICAVAGTSGMSQPTGAGTDGSVTWATIGPWTAATSTTGGAWPITYCTNAGNVYLAATNGTTVAASQGSGPVGNGVGIPDGTAAWTFIEPLTNPNQDGPLLSSDVLWFDQLLLTKGLMNAFRKRKGLDTSATQPEYDDAMVKAKSADSFAPVLSLNPRAGFPPLIGPSSVPQTGVGM